MTYGNSILKPNTIKYNNDFSISINSGLMDSPWPMKSHDTRHTGRSPYNTADNPGTEKWRLELSGWVEGGPIIDNDGVIYIGDSTPYFYAINTNGVYKWKSPELDGFVWSTPAISDDNILYFGTYGDDLWAMNPNGSILWRTDSGGSISSSPAIAEDGTIFIGNMAGFDKGNVVCFYSNGTIKWVYETGYKIISDPAIDSEGTIYIGSGDTYVYALNPNGTLKWRFKTGGYVKGHPSIADDGTVYIGSWDGYLYALSPSDGSEIWRIKLGSGTESNPTVGLDGTIYLGGDDFYAINPNGTLKWVLDLGQNRHVFKSCPAISADGMIYISICIGENDGGELISISSDGVELWRKKISNIDGESSPCISSDGTVYVGSAVGRINPNDMTLEDFGYLHAFGPIDSNTKPNAPIIIGPSEGQIGSLYYFYFSAADPDLNPVSFYIDWDDGNISNWTGGGVKGWFFNDVASGQETSIDKRYETEGNYLIRVKAKDSFGLESDWTEFEVTMKKSKNKPYSWLEQLPIIREVLLRLTNLTS